MNLRSIDYSGRHWIVNSFHVEWWCGLIYSWPIVTLRIVWHWHYTTRTTLAYNSTIHTLHSITNATKSLQLYKTFWQCSFDINYGDNSRFEYESQQGGDRIQIYSTFTKNATILNTLHYVWNQCQSFTTISLDPVSSGPPRTKKLHYAI